MIRINSKFNLWRWRGYIRAQLRGVACETCSATWNLGTTSAFALGLKKITQNLVLDTEQEAYNKGDVINLNKLRGLNRESAR
jgi:hypothetical protein